MAVEAKSLEGYPSRQAFNLWTWVYAQVDKAMYHPRAAPGVVVRRLTEDGMSYWVLKNPKLGTYLRLDEEDYSLWRLMDGTRSVKDLVVAYFQRHKSFAFGRVAALVDELRAEGFLTDLPVGVYHQAAEQLAERDWSYRWRQLAQAFLQQELYFENIDRYVTLAYRWGGRILFFKPILGLLTVLAVAGFVAFVGLLRRGTYAILAPDDASPGAYVLGLLTLLLINAVMIFIHESAHALTTRHFGREVRRGGVMIYYGMPAFFVDTVDIWLEPKKRRIAVSWAGPHAELIVAGLCSLLTIIVATTNLPGLLGALLFKVAFLGYFSVFINLNPLLELDGYFILGDWLGIPMLRQRSFAFIRDELPAKLRALLTDMQSASDEGVERAATFTREEIIFTVFGGLAALYTVYALWVAVYFWQTRIYGVLLDLWGKEPALIFKPLVSLLVTAVVVPIGLAVGTTAWAGLKKLADWLERRDFFERERNVGLATVGGLALVLLLPALATGPARQVLLVGLATLLGGLAVWTLVATAQQYAGAEFRAVFWGLAWAASLFLGGTLLRGLSLAVESNPQQIIDIIILIQQLATVGLLAAGVLSLAGVDWRRGPAWERVAVFGLLALGFVAVLPVARWTVGWPLVATVPAVASAYFALIFLALILPTLTAYIGTRFFIPWLALVLGAGGLGALNLARLSPGWVVGGGLDSWLELAAVALWAAGGLTYATAGGRMRFAGPHWSQDVAYSEEERLRVAFARFFESLFSGFRTTFGARRAQAVDDELDVIAVTADWDLEIDAGRVRDNLNLDEIPILEQADSYREVLDQTIDLMDDWAGSYFTARLAQAAYDSLPWPSRETLGRFVLAGTPWGGTIADRFESAQSERGRLLRSVPVFAGLNTRDFYLLLAALDHKEVSAGRVLARQGTPIRQFVLVQSGEVEVWQPDPATGRERLVGELRRGAAFGYEVFAGQGRHPATYRASVNTDILTISDAEAVHLRRAGVEVGTQSGGTLSTLQLLGRMPIFANLSPQQVGAVADRMRQVHVDAGQVIVRQGEPRHHFYVIVQGQVTVSVRDEAGEEKMLARLGRGEHFGEAALYSDQPYSATRRAETPVDLLALDEPTFDQLVSSSARMASYVEQVSSGWVLDTRRKLGTERP